MFRRLRAEAWALAAACPLVFGCMEGEWSDREPLIVDPAPVDSLEFLPPGSLYVLKDSLTPVRFSGFRPGYACTRVSTLRLEKRPAGGTAGYVPRLGLILPAAPDCPVDTGAGDTVLFHRFSSADGPVARLFDSLGAVLDTARIVRGALSRDSLVLLAPADSASNGRFTFRDARGGLVPLLEAGPLSPCELLNHAEYSRTGDTTKVRYSWVNLDPAGSGFSCDGPPRTGYLVAVPSSP